MNTCYIYKQFIECKILLIVLLAFISNLCAAQHATFFHLTETDGLPDYRFYDMIEDHKGNIWLACNNGLYRYDGLEYIEYTNIEKKGAAVFNLIEDSHDRIWCNNISGQIFYVENNQLHLFFDISPYVNTIEPNLMEVLDNYLYITSAKGILKINITTKQLSFEYKGYFKFVAKFNGKLYFLPMEEGKHVKKIISPDPDGKWKKYNYPIQIYKMYGTKSKLFGIGRKHNGEAIASYYTKTTLGENHFVNIKDFDNYINGLVHDIYEDTAGFFWFSTEKGAIRLKISNGRIIHAETFFSGDFIGRVIQDQNGSFWFATLEKGIFVIPNLSIKLYNTNNSGLHFNRLQALTKDDNGGLFYNISGSGVGKFNTKTKSFSTFRMFDQTDNTNFLKMEYHSNYESLVFSSSKGTKLLHKSEKEIFMYLSLKDYSIVNDSLLLYSTQTNTALVSNFIASNYHKKKQASKLFYNNTNKLILSKERAVSNHYSAKKKQMYVAYANRFMVYDMDSNSREITFQKKSIAVQHIVETYDGTIWLSSSQYGLFAIKNDYFDLQYNTDTGLISNHIFAMKADKNNVWIATPNGLQCIRKVNENTEQNQIITIDKNDGLITSEISDIEIVGPHVFLASQKGLIQIEKNKNYRNNKTPNITINNLVVNNKDTLPKGGYHLKHDTNMVISYGSNSFKSFNKPTYKYRLKGLSDNWITTTTNKVRYSSFPHGTYTFEVKAVNDDGLESTKPAILGFVIKPAFWTTWWFYLSIGAIFLGAIVLFFKLRIKRIKKENQIKEQKNKVEMELVSSKIQVLRSQMNPHFMFNSLNSIQEYILTGQKLLASDYLARFAELMRIYLDHSQRNFITLQEEIEALEIYLDLEKDRFEDSFEYLIDTKKIMKYMEYCKIPSFLIQPYVENAIKHGLLHKEKDQHLTVTFTKSLNCEDIILCEILDNGIGRAKAEEIKRSKPIIHKSFASEAGKTRLELLNIAMKRQIGITFEDLKDGNRAIGTRVLLSIPLIK